MTALRHDGHGIHRLPLEAAALAGVEIVLVRADELEALEALLYETRNVLAECYADALDWDDRAERAKFFGRATLVWKKALGALRGDDEAGG